MRVVAPALILSLGVVSRAVAAEPSADELLRRATAILAPAEFEAQISFVTHKANGQAKSFSIRMWKKGTDRTRFKFLSPADDRDMEVLRIGDDMWNYLPNLKRAIRVSSKQEFHGGDFSNADVLRVDLTHDYTAALGHAEVATEQLLELTAKNDQVAYHKVRLWLRAKDAMPLREELYTAAGKLVRRLEFQAPRAYGRLIRPSRYVMQNLLVQSRSTEMEWTAMRVAKSDDTLFQMASLGR
jgi:outer membrane lipoprotein-sorting protein